MTLGRKIVIGETSTILYDLVIDILLLGNDNLQYSDFSLANISVLLYLKSYSSFL